MSELPELPKLYREVGCKIEYVHDHCVNGEHDQRCGDYWLQVKRVKCDKLGWKWVPVRGENSDFDDYPVFCQREILEWLGECSGSLGYGLDWAYRQIDMKSSWKECDGYY